MESLNFIGLIKAAAGKEVDWSAPDANYNSPFLVAGMRLTPEQNAAYDEYKAMYGRAKRGRKTNMKKRSENTILP